METMQALSLGTLLIAASALVIAYVNMQTTRLSALVAALRAINIGQATEIDGLRSELAMLQSRVGQLESENLRLLTDLVRHLQWKEP